MRISETMLCQLVEGDPPTVVLVDETSGESIVLDPMELARAEAAASYFRATGAFPAAGKACEDEHPPFAFREEYAAVACLCETKLYDSRPAVNGLGRLLR